MGNLKKKILLVIFCRIFKSAQCYCNETAEVLCRVSECHAECDADVCVCGHSGK